VLKASSNTKWRADLKSANAIMLREAGVPDANIAISELCTPCDAAEFFSYRRDGVTGRMGGWMMIRG
jgi:copper oxidase (laccase) domain-containing protein